jgi:polyhydroxybutyrate depolymerase
MRSRQAGLRAGPGPRALLCATVLSVAVLGACDMQPGGQGDGCQNLRPGDFTCAVQGGEYLLHVPASYTGDAAVPLVVDAHGFTSNAEAQRRISGWLELSNREGFVVAYPQGGTDNAFNGQGECCDFDNSQNDVLFFRSIVTAVSAAGNVDASRVFGTGLSNGGSMAHTIACQAADIFIAVAPVSFQLSGANDTIAGTVAACNPARPVAVVHFHGTADNVTPYDDGVLDALSAPDSLDAWRQIQRCDPVNVDTRITSNTVCERHSACNGDAFVSLCTVQNGNHGLYGNVAASGMTIAEIAYPMLLEYAAIDAR